MSDDTLRQLLAPMDPATFVREYWDQKPLHLPGGAEKLQRLFREPFDRSAFDRAILAAGYTRHRRAGFSIRAFVEGPDGVQVQLPVTAEQVPDMLATGATMCVNEIEAGSDDLARIAADFKRAMGLVAPVRFNCYLSPNEEGLDTHFDARHAMTIQLEGRKRWRFSRQPGIEAPRNNALIRRGKIEHGDKKPGGQPGADQLTLPDESAFDEVVLKPGDVLYLPPGVWHDVKAVDGGSLALNLATEAVTTWEFVAGVLAHSLVRSVEWRRGLPATLSSESPDEGLPPALANLLSLRLKELKTLLEQVPARGLDVQRAWRSAVVDGPRRKAPKATVSVTDEALLRRVPETPLSFAVHSSPSGTLAVFLYVPNREIPLRPEALALLKSLSASPSFRASDMTRFFFGDWARTREVLELLVAHRVLELV